MLANAPVIATIMAMGCAFMRKWLNIALTFSWSIMRSYNSSRNFSNSVASGRWLKRSRCATSIALDFWQSSSTG